MKTRKLIAASLFVALTGLFISCDDDDTVSCTPDYTGALSDEETTFVGSWELTGITSDEEIDLTDDEEENPSTDIYAQQTECQNDIVYTFNSDRTYTYEQGGVVEDCEATEDFSGSWKLGGTTLGLVTNCYESIQTLEFNAEETEYTVQTSGIATDASGQQIQIVVTYTYSQKLAEIEPAN
ncbi:DUF5004 domain-containing protein [Joostella atrarenae]|uniref:DUF5004 domain-containing protein n=1 Tax=Joostella atrarenae TaxID=679257 RepID=A0ABS9IZL5_9FLAO|nr:DUF5004 domain-containing protein [Joostella atrarenae]MCF8713533.1 DUF5004 domain-containing protein [Joostella atrarenae]